MPQEHGEGTCAADEHPAANAQTTDVVEYGPAERVSSVFCFLFRRGDRPLSVEAPLRTLGLHSRRTPLDHRTLKIVDESDRDRFWFTLAGGDEWRESQEEEQDLAHGDLPSSTLLGKDQLSGLLGKPR